MVSADPVKAGFIARLRASRLIVWLPGYLAAAWVAVQLIALLGDVFDWPAIVPRATVLIAAWGIPAVIVLTWFHGPRGHQRVTAVEVVLLLSCFVAATSSVLLQWRSMQALEAGAGLTANVEVAETTARSIAVLPFVGLDASPEQKRFAEGLADQIVGVMSVNDLQAIPNARSEDFRGTGMREAARSIGAAFVLDGTVRLDGGDLRVRAHINETKSSVTLWSSEYRRTSAESVEMQEQVATHVADVLRCALVARRPNAGDIDTQTLAIFLRACDMSRRYERGPEEVYEAARQVTERAPGFSRGWSMLAIASVLASRNVSPDRALQLRAEAAAAAETARSLDPQNAECDIALSLLLPFTAWRERQELLRHALELDPNSAEANMFQGFLLAEVGRMTESLAYFRRAVALDPLSPSQRTAMTPVLDVTGNYAEARDMRERNARVWPNSPSTWHNQFNGAMFTNLPDVALAMLDAIDTAPVSIEPPVVEALRSYIEATRASDRAAIRAALEGLAALVREGRFDAPRAISASSRAGELDFAFDLAAAYFSNPEADPANRQPVMTAHRYFLFTRPGEPMRRDPRFMALAKGFGLLDYWTETGKWPDFCSDPELAYDCRNEAALIAQRQ